jgi:hypothetical protein
MLELQRILLAMLAVMAAMVVFAMFHQLGRDDACIAAEPGAPPAAIGAPPSEARRLYAPMK